MSVGVVPAPQHRPLLRVGLAVLDDDEALRHGAGDVVRLLQVDKASAARELGGRRVGEMNDVLGEISRQFAGLDAKGRGTQTFDERVMIHALTAVESSLLDLMGQSLGVPVAKLLGEGQQRSSVETLGYLFFVGDATKTSGGYVQPTGPADSWERIR